MVDEAPVLELRGITKRFPGVVANDSIDFDLRRGEVHALLGETGPGKSTLMNIVYGRYAPDEGEIRIKGQPVALTSPLDAIERGTGVLPQHFTPSPAATVAATSEGATEKGLARSMVGREVLLRVEKSRPTTGETLLEVDDLSVTDERALEAVRNVSFDVRAGEIVGIAGVDGNGQTELIDALTGLRRGEQGTIKVAGRQLWNASAREMLDAGLGHIPEDRQRRGLVLEFSIAENIALHDYAEPPDAKWGWLFPARLVERARRLIKEFDVRGGGPLTRAGGLSGGNQQKVVVAREIARDPKVLIAAQPTRGIDVGAIEYLHGRLVDERDRGRAILLISLELDEVLSLSDRVLVIYEGKIVGEHSGDVSEQEIGLEMLGGREKSAA